MATVPETSLKPFLKRSAGVHVALLAAAIVLARHAGKPPEQVYRIDFIGGSPAILNRETAPAQKAATERAPLAVERPRRERSPDEFNLRPSFRPLPRPSFMEAAAPEKVKRQPSFAPIPSEAPPAPSAPPAATAGPGGPGTDVTADMPDFPYPWYLTSLRQKLWEQWAQNMPPGPAQCEVAFSILRDGSVVDLQVESTSGDRTFDYAALSAVRGIGGLPPLPPAFKESFLKVHVTFKAN